MELGQREKEMIYKLCEDYIDKNKKIYEDTLKSKKYNNIIEKTVEKINVLQLIVNKYDTDEKNYKNRMVNVDMHSYIHKVRYQIEDLCEDVIFYNNKLCDLEISEDIYFNYIYCQNDLHRLKNFKL
jgi:hypothetical protein